MNYHSSITVSRNRFRRTAGYSLVELIIVIAVISIIFGIVSVTVSSYAARQSLSSFHQEVIENINTARVSTLASLNDTVYGVYVGTTSIAFFSGTSYSPSDPNNSYLNYTSKITATSSLSGGTSTVVFDRLTGEASAFGDIIIFDRSSAAYATVTIFASGLVE